MLWTYSANVKPAISAMSEPTGPQGSLLVAALFIHQSAPYDAKVATEAWDCPIPFRTLTWALVYPFVTFLTLLTTFDMVAVDWANGDRRIERMERMDYCSSARYGVGRPSSLRYQAQPKWQRRSTVQNAGEMAGEEDVEEWTGQGNEPQRMSWRSSDPCMRD